MRPNDVESSQDFSKYYTSGWVCIREPGVSDIIPFRSDANDATTVVGHKLEYSKEQGRYIERSVRMSYNEFMQKAELGRPDVGMTQHGKNLKYLMARSRRDHHRGLRTNAVDSVFFNGWDSRNYNQRVPVNDWVWNVFNPKYWDADTAYKDILGGSAVGLPLSMRMGIVAIKGESNPRLVYKQDSVGWYDGRIAHILSQFRDYTELFQSELRKEVRLV